MLLTTLICVPIFLYAQKQESGLKYPAEQMNRKEVKALIDSLENALNRCYVFHDKVPIMLANVKRNHKSGAYLKIDNPTKLASQLLKNIQQVYKDGHLNIQYYPELSEFLEKPMPDSIKQLQLERNLISKN